VGDIKKRMAAIRARRFGKHFDFYSDGTGWEALKRAKAYFGVNADHIVAMAMAEVLFGAPGRGRKKGSQSWDDKHLIRLGRAYYIVKRKHPDLTDTKIAQIISLSPDYKEYRGNSEPLRQRLRKAKRVYDSWEDHERSRSEEGPAEEQDIGADDD
jgi:hypothetical protein